MPYSPYVSSTVSSKNREQLQQLQKNRLQVRRHVEINNRIRAAQEDEEFENTAIGQMALQEVEREIEEEPGENKQEFRRRKIQAVKQKMQEIRKRMADKLKKEMATKAKRAMKNVASKVVSPAANALKQAMAQIAKQAAAALVRAVVWMLMMIGGVLILKIAIAILIVTVVVVAITVVDETCNASWVSSAICSAASWVSSWF